MSCRTMDQINTYLLHSMQRGINLPRKLTPPPPPPLIGQPRPENEKFLTSP